LVSKRTKRTKRKAAIQNTPNSQKAPYEPITISIDENHFVTQKPRIQQIEVAIELAFDLMLGENISPATAHGSGPNLF
jgi:hypothetical protein